MSPLWGLRTCKVCSCRLSSLAQDQSRLWLVFAKNWWGASWLPGTCFCTIYHTQIALQLEKKSHDSCSQSSPAMVAGFPPFLVSTPSSRANWQKPSSRCEKGTKETMQTMVKLVDNLPSWSFIKYSFNTHYVLGLGETVVNKTAHTFWYFWFGIICALGSSHLPPVAGRETATYCSFVQSPQLAHGLPPAHILLPSQPLP